MLKRCRRLLYCWGPRFPEDVQFAKKILRTQIVRLAAGEAMEEVAPQTQAHLQPFRDRGYSPLRISTICAEARKHLLIEKAMVARAEREGTLSQSYSERGIG